MVSKFTRRGTRGTCTRDMFILNFKYRGCITVRVRARVRVCKCPVCLSSLCLESILGMEKFPPTPTSSGSHYDRACWKNAIVGCCYTKYTARRVIHGFSY